jgi:TRAP transporter 4TM/12TM fusion protein
MMVDSEAAKAGLRGLPRQELPPVYGVLKRIYLSLPLVVVVYALLVGFTPMIAGLWAWYVSLGIIFFANIRRFSIKLFKELLAAMAEGSKNLMPVTISVACASIIVGVIILTGFGLKITNLVVMFSHGSLAAALGLTMIACIIIGMGLPTLPAYLVAVALVVPALNDLGVQPLIGHFFVLYFSVISCITMPVAIASYAAAGVAKANPFSVGIQATRLGIAAYLVPFLFVYRPELLLIGTPSEIAIATVMSGAGVLSLAWAVIGFMSVSLHPLERLVLATCSFLMLIPGLTSGFIGMFLALMVYLSQKIRAHRALKSREASKLTP